MKGRDKDPLGLAPGGEFDLIRRFLAGAAAGGEGVRVGPGDDCAVVVGQGIALSSDMSVEEVHFRREWLTPRQIGCRAACAALSDLAAVAARPIGVLASVALHPRDASQVATGVMEGVRDAVEGVGGVVLGGDLTRSPGPLVVDVTVVGEVTDPVLRSGARPGDEVWVTGELGGAAAAVARLLRGERLDPTLDHRFVCPTPRVPEARWLQQRGVLRAMLDLSDGLVGDAAHLAASSGVAVVLEREQIPVHPAAARGADPDLALQLAVSGGEDYELCFAAAPGTVEPLVESFQAELGVRLTRVGRVEEGGGVYWRAPDGRVPVGRGGFQHFGDDA